MICKEIMSKFPDAHVITAGDLNDGPGQGFFETFYGLINVLDALLGSDFYGTKTLHHLIKLSETMFSCEFDDYVDRRLKKVLLDHVFVSKNTKNTVINATIAHDVYQQYLKNGGRDRQDRISDHRPVVVDFDKQKL